jgi:hypothetical protein
MAVSFDVVGPSSAGAASTGSLTLSWSHTCASSATTLLVGIAFGSNGVSNDFAQYTSSCTYNGVAMTLIASPRSNNTVGAGNMLVYALQSPPTGSAYTVAFSCTAGGTAVGPPNSLVGGSLSFIGSIGLGTPVTNFGNGTAASVTLPSSISGNQVAAFVCNGTSIGSGGAQSPLTSRYLNNAASNSGAGTGGGATGASTGSSILLNWTGNGSDWWAIVGVEVQAPSAPVVVSEQGQVYSSSVGAFSAWVNPNGVSTTVSFNYGATSSYGSNTGTVATITGTAPVYVSYTQTGLSSGQTVHFQASATSTSGSVTGPDASFTTTPTPYFSGLLGQGLLGASPLGYGGAAGATPGGSLSATFTATANAVATIPATSSATGTFTATAAGSWVPIGLTIISRGAVTGGSSTSTPSFTPPAGAMLVVGLNVFAYSAGTASISDGFGDTGGGTWAPLAGSSFTTTGTFGQMYGGWYRLIGTGASASTVSVAVSGFTGGSNTFCVDQITTSTGTLSVPQTNVVTVMYPSAPGPGSISLPSAPAITSLVWAGAGAGAAGATPSVTTAGFTQLDLVNTNLIAAATAYMNAGPQTVVWTALSAGQPNALQVAEIAVSAPANSGSLTGTFTATATGMVQTWAPNGAPRSGTGTPVPYTTLTLGDVLWCWAIVNTAPGVAPTFTVTGGGVTNWYQMGPTYAGVGQSGYALGLFYGAITTVGTNLNISVTPSAGTVVGMGAQEFHYLLGTSPTYSVDTSGSSTGTNNTLSLPVLAPANPGELYLGYGVANNTFAGTTPGFAFSNDIVSNLVVWSLGAPNPSAPVGSASAGGWDAIAGLITVVPPSSTGSLTATFTATAAGLVTFPATGSVTSIFSATATGTSVVVVAGSGSVLGAFSGASVGLVRALGAGSASGTFTASASASLGAIGALGGTFTASATGKVTVAGTASAVGAFAATSTGIVLVAGTASAAGAFLATATGTAVTVVQGSGALAGAFSALAIGVVVVPATGSITGLFFSTATGTSYLPGTGQALGSFSALSTGLVTIPATGALVSTFTALASSGGSGAATGTFTALATGLVRVPGSGVLTGTFTATASGTLAGTGTAVGTFSATAAGLWTGAASASLVSTFTASAVGTGTQVFFGTGGGVGTFTGLGTGVVVLVSHGSLTTTFTGAATGAIAGTASGTGTFVATATGLVTVPGTGALIGAFSGTGQGAWAFAVGASVAGAFTAQATGLVTISATGALTGTFSAIASSSLTQHGTGAVSGAFSAMAVGSAAITLYGSGQTVFGFAGTARGSFLAPTFPGFTFKWVFVEASYSDTPEPIGPKGKSFDISFSDLYPLEVASSATEILVGGPLPPPVNVHGLARTVGAFTASAIGYWSVPAIGALLSTFTASATGTVTIVARGGGTVMGGFTATAVATLSVGLVVSVTPGTRRNDYGGWVGMQVVVGTSSLLVSQLGRWVLGDNTGAHAVDLLNGSGNVLGSVTIYTVGATPNAFAYAPLSTSVVMVAEGTYYLVSEEVSGGDYWLGNDTVVALTADAAAASLPVYGAPGAIQPGGSVPGTTFVPVDLFYQIMTGLVVVSIWDGATPANLSVYTDPTGPANLGVVFQSNLAGSVFGVQFYKGAGVTGVHTGSLWDADGNLLATGTFTNETASGWQQLYFTTPVPIAANTNYTASYITADPSIFAFTNAGLATGVTNGPLMVPASGGVYTYGDTNTFPDNISDITPNYWVDVLFGVVSEAHP